MQSSRALRALPVVLWLAPTLSLAAQARYRVTTDGAWFYQEPEGKRLARLARGTIVVGGESQDAWQGVTLEGWIFATSVGPTPRAGYDLAVSRAPEENLRSAPAGALIARLPQGFLLNKVAEGTSGSWVHVLRAGWVEKAAVESLAQVASSDPDSGGPTPGPRPGAPATPGHGPGVGPPESVSDVATCATLSTAAFSTQPARSTCTQFPDVPSATLLSRKPWGSLPIKAPAGADRRFSSGARVTARS